MCRSIVTLRGEEPATDDEVSAAALQLPATICARSVFDISNSLIQCIPAESGAGTLASCATVGSLPDSVGHLAADISPGTFDTTPCRAV